MAEKRQLATLDCETDPFKFGRAPSPFLWGLYTPEKYSQYMRLEDCVADIKKNNYKLYAHNGGKFDFIFLLEHLEGGQALKIINGRLAEFKMKESILRDSYCRFPMALSKFQKTEIDYRKLEANKRGKHWDEICAYLKDDCRFLYDLMSVYDRDYGQGLTIAGGAAKFWEKQSGSKMPHSTPGYYKQYSPFYIGGRVESFKRGIFKKKIEVSDINSAYPYAMLHPHPWGFEAVRLSQLPDSNWGQCLLEIESESLGLFPHVQRTGTSFPRDGEWRTFHISGWELQTALDHIPELNFKVRTCHYFKQSIQFTEYVEYFYKLKASYPKETAEYLFAKLMMNSLYGKFGANPEEYRNYRIVSPGRAHEWADEGYDLVDRCYPWDLIAAPLDENAQRFYDVAVAASITGFVRAYLLNALLSNFGKEFYNEAYYVDTDCIHAEKGIKLAYGRDLGQWTKEFEADSAAYAGKKLYALSRGTQTKIASKGVRLSANDIRKVAAGATLKWKNPAPTMSLKGGTRFLEREVKATI